MRRRDFLAAAVAGIAFGCILPERLTAPRREGARVAAPLFGIGAHLLEPRAIEAIAGLGVKDVRHTLYWGLWSDAAYREQFTEGVQRAADAGLRLLVVVHQAPGRDVLSDADAPQAFADFVAERAASLPVEAWQLWNEMDLGFAGSERFFDAPTLRERGAQYGTWLTLATPAIRENSKAWVVAGGTATDGREWYAGVGDAPRDVDAVHAYGVPLVDAFRERAKVRGQRPLWVTEFGLEKAVIPWEKEREAWEAYQAEQIVDCLEANREVLYERAYLHVLWDNAPEGHGILRPDYSPRPAYEALKGRSV